MTGATGYVGSALIRRLVEAGHQVAGVVREGSDTSNSGGIQTQVHDGTASGMVDLLEATKPEVVVHLATLYRRHHSGADIDDMVGSNIGFGVQLLEAMTQTGVRCLINTGSHFENAVGGAPVNLYAATKRAFGEICAYYQAEWALSLVTLVPFDVYGPGEVRRKLIPELIDSVESRREIRLAANNPLIDLIHVDDVVEAYLLAVEGLAEGTLHTGRFDLSSGRPLRLSEVVDAVESVSGVTLTVVWDEDLNSVPATQNAPRKSLPDWRPRVPLPQGIAGLLVESRAARGRDSSPIGRHGGHSPDSPGSSMPA